MAHQRHAPKHDIDRKVFRYWDSLDDPVSRIFNNQDGDVDAGC